MMVRRKALAIATCAPMLLFAATAAAQQPAPAAPGESQHPGRQVLMAKCFQCHTDAMWRDARQDARSWEAALYRMVGRGGIWTTEEIKQMSDYLGTDFGPNAKPAEPSR